MSVHGGDMWGHEKKHIWKKKGGNSGKFGCLTSARHFLYDKLWFLSFKKVWKECDYDESAQFACDTEWRMNGHVKSMHFQQFMEAAASKFYYIYFSVKTLENTHIIKHTCILSCFSFVHAYFFWCLVTAYSCLKLSFWFDFTASQFHYSSVVNQFLNYLENLANIWRGWQCLLPLKHTLTTEYVSIKCLSW